jgi:hypothetical protein
MIGQQRLVGRTSPTRTHTHTHTFNSPHTSRDTIDGDKKSLSGREREKTPPRPQVDPKGILVRSSHCSRQESEAHRTLVKSGSGVDGD